MKTAGWILIVLGIIMIIIRGFSVSAKKNIVNAVPVQINKTENKWIGWPTYAGGMIVVIGLGLLLLIRRNKQFRRTEFSIFYPNKKPHLITGPF